MNCNGSFINSAKNITYNNNIIQCELKTINGNWTKNKLTFFPQIDYTNVDGKFEWNNCKNNVNLNNYSHEHITRRYKPVSIKECLDNLTSEYDDWFTIEKEYINCIKDKCISISLFKKNSGNTYDNNYEVNNEYWLHKYYKSLIHNLNTYKYSNMCVNLYLANDLSNLIPELSKYSFLNIFLMKSSSIGASPGALWRFINITNHSYIMVFISDIDDNWNWIEKWNTKENGNYKLCTKNPSDNLITPYPYVPAYNFPTIMAGYALYSPRKFNYDIVDVMKGFISLCKLREKSDNPYCFHDNDPITYWNQPVNEHKYGWGRLTTVYGFDEFFLKHVIYHDVYPNMRFI
jgi:hypothetical protein